MKKKLIVLLPCLLSLLSCGGDSSTASSSSGHTIENASSLTAEEATTRLTYIQAHLDEVYEGKNIILHQWSRQVVGDDIRIYEYEKKWNPTNNIYYCHTYNENYEGDELTDSTDEEEWYYGESYARITTYNYPSMDYEGTTKTVTIYSPDFIKNQYEFFVADGIESAVGSCLNTYTKNASYSGNDEENTIAVSGENYGGASFSVGNVVFEDGLLYTYDYFHYLSSGYSYKSSYEYPSNLEIELPDTSGEDWSSR